MRTSPATRLRPLRVMSRDSDSQSHRERSDFQLSQNGSRFQSHTLATSVEAGKAYLVCMQNADAICRSRSPGRKFGQRTFGATCKRPEIAAQTCCFKVNGFCNTLAVSIRGEGRGTFSSRDLSARVNCLLFQVFSGTVSGDSGNFTGFTHIC